MRREVGAAALVLAAAGAACSSSPVIRGSPPGSPEVNVLLNPPVNEADVEFMTGMIPHHAQAVKIASWAASHGASPSLQILAERIVVAQRDEIELMRTWLADRKQPVPPPDATHHRMTMNGMTHDMLMPGMMTDEELAQLDAARGVEFDRLFLTFMIRHHEGALEMVEKLHGSLGAAQDEMVFRLSADVFADQTTEIERMQKMLEALPPAGGSR